MSANQMSLFKEVKQEYTRIPKHFFRSIGKLTPSEMAVASHVQERLYAFGSECQIVTINEIQQGFSIGDKLIVGPTNLHEKSIKKAIKSLIEKGFFYAFSKNKVIKTDEDIYFFPPEEKYKVLVEYLKQNLKSLFYDFRNKVFSKKLSEFISKFKNQLLRLRVKMCKKVANLNVHQVECFFQKVECNFQILASKFQKVEYIIPRRRAKSAVLVRVSSIVLKEYNSKENNLNKTITNEEKKVLTSSENKSVEKTNVVVDNKNNLEEKENIPSIEIFENDFLKNSYERWTTSNFKISDLNPGQRETLKSMIAFSNNQTGNLTQNETIEVIREETKVSAVADVAAATAKIVQEVKTDTDQHEFIKEQCKIIGFKGIENFLGVKDTQLILDGIEIVKTQGKKAGYLRAYLINDGYKDSSKENVTAGREKDYSLCRYSALFNYFNIKPVDLKESVLEVCKNIHEKIQTYRDNKSEENLYSFQSLVSDIKYMSGFELVRKEFSGEALQMIKGV